MTATPIADHALLSDRHSAALVSRDGSVDWLCFPRFDSPRCSGGCSTRRPGTGRSAPSTRTPRRPAATSTTRWCWRRRSRRATGTARRSPTRWRSAPRRRRRTRSAPSARTCWSARLECTGGEVEVDVELRPAARVRPGRAAARRRSTGGVTARGGAEWLVLSSPVPLDVAGCARAPARCALRAGEPLHFALHHRTTSEPPARALDRRRSSTTRCDDTVDAWRSWSGLHQSYDGPWARPGAPQRPGAAGADLPARPARSSPRRRPRCPRRSAASATGTTATPGSATPASPWRRCGWPPAPTRPTSSSTSWPTPRRPRSGAGATCRSCSASAASTT